MKFSGGDETLTLYIPIKIVLRISLEETHGEFLKTSTFRKEIRKEMV